MAPPKSTPHRPSVRGDDEGVVLATVSDVAVVLNEDEIEDVREDTVVCVSDVDSEDAEEAVRCVDTEVAGDPGVDVGVNVGALLQPFWQPFSTRQLSEDMLIMLPIRFGLTKNLLSIG